MNNDPFAPYACMADLQRAIRIYVSKTFPGLPDKDDVAQDAWVEVLTSWWPRASSISEDSKRNFMYALRFAKGACFRSAKRRYKVLLTEYDIAPTWMTHLEADEAGYINEPPEGFDVAEDLRLEGWRPTRLVR